MSLSLFVVSESNWVSNIRSYKDLKVWQKAIEITEIVCDISDKFPDDERFELRQQIRRASVSVASNIAEGWGRKLPSSFIHFLRIARGSLYEMETQFIICHKREMLSSEDHVQLTEMIDHISRMMNSLIRKVGEKSSNLGEGTEPYFTIT